jgi:hypothetical protein
MKTALKAESATPQPMARNPAKKQAHSIVRIHDHDTVENMEP